jgi:multiple sugar transport system permease protein
MMNKKKRWVRILSVTLLWIFVLSILLIIDFPIINTVMTSLKTDADISHTPPKFIFSPTFDHYKYIFSKAGFNFQRFVLNSIIVALFSSFFVILICLPAAYSIVRSGGFGRVVMSTTLAFRLFPSIVIALPMFLIYQRIHLVDTRSGLVLVHIFFMLPTTLLLLIGFIRDLPREIEEAAIVDGASNLQALTYVTLPLILPGIASVFILSIVASWNEYLFAVILTFERAVTATVGATLFITSWGIRWGPMAAAITVSTLPTLLFIFISHRYIIRGMTLGAVKG